MILAKDSDAGSRIITSRIRGEISQSALSHGADGPERYEILGIASAVVVSSKRNGVLMGLIGGNRLNNNLQKYRSGNI